MPTSYRTQAFPSLFGLCTALMFAGCGGDTARDPGQDGECEGLIAGDLVISEIMINPMGADDGKEWFEIYNATSEPIDLTGVVVRYSKVDNSGEKFHTIGGAPGGDSGGDETGAGETGEPSGEGLTVEPGQYVVLAGAEELALPAFAAYAYGNAFSMGNTAGKLGLGCAGSEIDTVNYDMPGDGASYTFDGSRPPDAAGNDDITAWCDAVTPLDDDTFGTPGTANDPCFGATPTVCVGAAGERDVVPPGEGDLVISEFMPDPSAVGDTEGEWFEIYVNRSVDLNGLGIGKIGEEPTTIIGDSTCLGVVAGDYLVFAKTDDMVLNGGLPQVDFIFDLAMSNSGSNLSLTWGETVVDNVMWASSSSGKATSLDPGSLDAVANDNLDSFCPATEGYGLGDLGTPGTGNPKCPLEPVEGMCDDGNGLREIVRPGVGDLVITEYMPNPSAVGDGDGEWFEVLVKGDFDLNELEIGRNGEVDEMVEEPACVSVSAGDYLLFAKNGETLTNGGLPAVDVIVSLSLVNSNGSLFLGSQGTVVDELAWTSSFDGAASALDPSFTDAADNDVEGNFCEATVAYGDGDFGTPRAENPNCGGSPPGTCLVGDVARDIVYAAPGDLVITEWMADPSAVGDSDGEWFEVLVNANIDLNGLQFGDDPTNPDEEVPNSGECLPATVGERLVFAVSDDPLVNGGIDNVAVVYSFGLTNGGDTIFVGALDTVIDEVTFGGSTPGSSTSVMPAFETAAGNDAEANHCESGTPYGAGDNGTPGAANVCI